MWGPGGEAGYSPHLLSLWGYSPGLGADMTILLDVILGHLTHNPHLCLLSQLSNSFFPSQSGKGGTPHLRIPSGHVNGVI